MKLYKLTDQEGYTRRNQTGQTQWNSGFSMELPNVENPELCTNQVIHAYKNINLAFLLNLNHANIANPRIWEAGGDIACEDWGKVGCFKLSVINELQSPEWLKTHKKEVQVWFAILCAESVLKYFENKYPKDARPRKAIEAAKEYLKNPSADSAAYAAADAAYAAADAAADAADAAAYAAADAAYAAADAAYAAADAAADQIDFGKLADMAVENVISGGDE